MIKNKQDAFGITKFYPTMQAYTDWQSTHWDNSNPRTIGTSERDYDDPTGWAHVRGNPPINTGAESAEYKYFSLREIDPSNLIQILPK